MGPESISNFSTPYAIYKPALCIELIFYGISKYKSARCLMVLEGPMSIIKLMFKSVL